MGSVFSSFFRPAHPQLPRPEPWSEWFARLGACVPLVPFDHGQVWLATGLGSCWLVEVGTVDREQTSWNREHPGVAGQFGNSGLASTPGQIQPSAKNII